MTNNTSAISDLTTLSNADFWAQISTQSLLVKRARQSYGQLFEKHDFLQVDQLNAVLESQHIDTMLARLEQVDCKVDGDVMAFLRQVRQCLMSRIVARDVAGLSEVPETLKEISVLADQLIDCAYRVSYQNLAARFGAPELDNGDEMHLAIIGMGKLGGFELNFSSDVDLILVFPHSGETSGSKSIAYEEFFRRVAQQMMKLLSTVTADGFVYRVDLRLRPFGDSGPLVCSANAFEQYYLVHGREWERYALIKSRAIAGDTTFGEQVLSDIEPFVYRRYLDYSTFESLREMKRLISKQVEKKGITDNIKLGRGGIREIEFIVQAHQLIYGGRERQLRTQKLYAVLDHLQASDTFSDQSTQKLREAYDFLRKAENQLQNYDDKQTQMLPTEEALQARLASIMGFADYEAFLAQLTIHRRAVETVFDDLFASDDRETDSEQSNSDAALYLPNLIGGNSLSTLWEDQVDARQHVSQWFEELGVSDENSTSMSDALIDLMQSRRFRAVSPEGQQQLVKLIPLLLEDMQSVAETDQVQALVFKRLLEVIKQICSRTVYLSLLLESALVRRQLIEIASRSKWAMDYIAQHPMVMDELIGQVSNFQTDNRAEMVAKLDAHIDNADGDLEQQLDMARQFKQSQLFRIAVADISEQITLMQVSDQLTQLAEVILNKELALAQDEVSKRHGLPRTSDGELVELGIVAFGKLGGIELGYGSDLDVVFIHNSDSPHAVTDGAKPIDHNQFFAKLAQKLISRLTTPTLIGPLYEIDTRLRPSGNSGVLVSRLPVFESYQLNEAWTWEHQALCRTRLVAGSDALVEAFTEVKTKVLSQQRDKAALQQEVANMRLKMRKELAPKPSEPFHIKHSPGGIVDIEFIVQYLLLAHANDHPEIIRWSDNIRQIEDLAAAKILDTEDANMLTQSYLMLRQYAHAEKLLGAKNTQAQTNTEEMSALTDKVSALWDTIFTV